MSKVVSARYYEQLDDTVRVQYRELLQTTQQKDIFYLPQSLARSCVTEEYRVAGSTTKDDSSSDAKLRFTVSNRKRVCSFSFDQYIVVSLCYQKGEKTLLSFYVAEKNIFSPTRSTFFDLTLSEVTFSRCFSVGGLPNFGCGLKLFTLDPKSVVVVVWVDDEIVLFMVSDEQSSIFIEKQFSFSFGSSVRDISINGLYDPWFAAICMSGSIYYGKLLDPMSTSTCLLVKGMAVTERKRFHLIHFCSSPFSAIILSDSGKMYLLDMLNTKMEQVWFLPSFDEGIVDRFISVHRSKSNPFEFYVLTRFHIRIFDERQLRHPVMSFAHFLMSFQPFCLDVYHMNGNALLVVGCERCVRLFIVPQVVNQWNIPHISEPHHVHLHLHSLFSVPENMKGFQLYRSHKLSFPRHSKKRARMGDAVFVHSTIMNDDVPRLFSVRGDMLYFCSIVMNESNPMEYLWHPIGSLELSEDRDKVTLGSISEQSSMSLIENSISEWNKSCFLSIVSQLLSRLSNPSFELETHSIVSSELISSHVAKMEKEYNLQVPQLSSELLSDILERLPDSLELDVDCSSQERFMDRRKQVIGSLLDRNTIDRVKDAMDECIVSSKCLETMTLWERNVQPEYIVPTYMKYYVVNAKSENTEYEEFCISDEMRKTVEDVWSRYFSEA
ncbi:hypothetical protein GpartN1_g5913.t1 [Galdieria partita]|uniref:Uncharacterized protein n=1 Tax=Galdieria partita TaxID=83374 RepID=A0A9C7USX4_9RHOD|nr:hypothetical protein GpartN1_g5913.t1 [Galdieria partita]